MHPSQLAAHGGAAGLQLMQQMNPLLLMQQQQQQQQQQAALYQQARALALSRVSVAKRFFYDTLLIPLLDMPAQPIPQTRMWPVARRVGILAREAGLLPVPRLRRCCPF